MVTLRLFPLGFFFQILIGLLIPVFIIFLFLVLKLYPWTKIKMNHYKKQGISCFYFPFLGYFKKRLDAFREYGDYYYFSRRKARDCPERLICSNLVSTPYLILLDPGLIKEFCLNTDNYVKEPLVLDLFPELLGQGLVMAEGNQWKVQKKMMSSFFHFDLLNSILPIVQKTAVEKFSNLKKGPMKEVDIMTIMQSISGDIIGKLFFGDDLEDYRFEGKNLTVALSDLINETFTPENTSERYIFGTFLSRYIPKHRNMIKKIKSFRKACIDCVEKRRKNEQSKLKKDIIQALLQYSGETGKQSEVNIVDQFISFFLPALDTSGHLLTMSIYYLACYPEYKNKIEEEVAIYYRPGKVITIEELSKFEYLTAFLKEVLRTATPLGDIFARKAVRDHMLKDIHIKKGDILNIDYYYNNYNPAYFSNPDDFDPNRWFSKEKRFDPYVFTPFSAGPRSCIGQHLAMNEIKVILCEWLNTFDFTVKEGYQLKMILKFLYGPVDPILLNLTSKN